jgi:hypothetical protein
MKRFTALFLSALLGITLVGCNNSDDEPTGQITGIWESIEVLGNSQYYQGLVYHFKADFSYEAILLTGQQDTGEVTGFLYHETGNYSLSGDLLRLISQDIRLHTGSNDTADSLEELEESDNTRDDIVNISLEENGAILVFRYGGCDDTSSCIDKHTFSNRQAVFW